MESKFAVKGHPLHPPLVAVPIGLFVWTLVADLVYLRSADPVWFAISFWSGVAAILAALLAALPGFGDYFTLARHSRAKRIATFHMVLNLFTVTLFAIAALLQRTVAPVTGEGFGSIATLHGIAVGAVTLAGWLGGEMVFRHRLAVREPELEHEPVVEHPEAFRHHA